MLQDPLNKINQNKKGKIEKKVKRELTKNITNPLFIEK